MVTGMHISKRGHDHIGVVNAMCVHAQLLGLLDQIKRK